MSEVHRPVAKVPGAGMTAPRWSNRPVAWLLRSPLHGLVSRHLMLISYRGTKTGATHTIPVGYVEGPDGLYVLVGEFESKRWWRNVEAGAAVQLTLRGREVDAYAEVVEGDIEPALKLYLAHSPGSARSLGVRIVDGLPDVHAVHAAAPYVLMVRCSLA